MKTVTPWTEEVLYADCPHCKATNELGSGLIWSDGAQQDCTDCGRTFAISRAKDEDDL